MNHIFFVDDNVIICRATVGDWNEVQKILDTYKVASRQRVNKHKKGNEVQKILDTYKVASNLHNEHVPSSLKNLQGNNLYNIQVLVCL